MDWDRLLLWVDMDRLSIHPLRVLIIFNVVCCLIVARSSIWLFFLNRIKYGKNSINAVVFLPYLVVFFGYNFLLQAKFISGSFLKE